MEQLTPRQAEILSLIQRHIEDTGFPPTRSEIAKELGFRSANAAEDHLKALARKGFIEILSGTSRGIRILIDTSKEEGIPLIGKVAAGNPVLAIENIENYINVPHHLFNPSADYFLRVQGMSMKDAGILDGDLLAVHSANEANNGQIVVARIDEEVTVKRLQKNRSKYLITLVAENPEFEPIEVDLRDQDFAIEGIYVGILRQD